MNKADSALSAARPGSRGPAHWNEADILQWIGRLTAEKDLLRRSHQGRILSADDTARLALIESTLDQSWDLVRQRRARRAAGKAWDDIAQSLAELVKNHRG